VVLSPVKTEGKKHMHRTSRILIALGGIALSAAATPSFAQNTGDTTATSTTTYPAQGDNREDHGKWGLLGLLGLGGLLGLKRRDRSDDHLRADDTSRRG
jgi:MYXO-CTERM domain-containing protein